MGRESPQGFQYVPGVDLIRHSLSSVDREILRAGNETAGDRVLKKCALLIGPLREWPLSSGYWDSPREPTGHLKSVFAIAFLI